jgi:hypothetical protein
MVVGVDLLSLITYITAWPDATLALDEMAEFVYHEEGGLYSHQAISKHLSELDITKKRASTEGYQTKQPDMQFRLELPPPLGIFPVP